MILAITLFGLWTQASLATAESCPAVTWKEFSLRNSQPDWATSDLILESGGKTLATESLPVRGGGATCTKLVIDEKSGLVLVTFRQGVAGTRVLLEDELLMVFRINGSKLEKAATVVLRTWEGRSVHIRVKSYKIVPGQSGWALELKEPKKTKLVPLG